MKDASFRFDEALHRGATHFVLHQAGCGKMPLWMREGFARSAAMAANPEWTPSGLRGLIASLRGGAHLKLKDLEREFIGGGNARCRLYSGLAVREWAERYGFDGLRQLLARLRAGEEWTADNVPQTLAVVPPITGNPVLQCRPLVNGQFRNE